MQNKETKQEQLSFHTENFRKRSRYTFVFVCMIAAFFVITVLNINTGNVHISVPKILRILFLHDGEAVEYSIIWKIRLPRILMAALLGGALSLSGFLLQTFFSNPIAGPFVLGISSGAKMAVALTMIVFLKYVGHFSSYTLVVAAFIGSLISTGFILLMSKKIHHMASLLVGGIMIGYICSAITDFVVTFADDSDIVNLHGWSQGSFSGMSWGNIKVAVVVVGIAAVCTFLLSFSPLFFGMTMYFNPDYALAVFFIFLLYSYVYDKAVLAAFFSLLCFQTKETGLVLVGGLVFGIFIQHIAEKRSHAVKAIFKDVKLYAILAVTLLQLYYTKFIGGIATWTQNGNEEPGLRWDSTGENCLGFQPAFVAVKLKQQFLLNFNWILTAGIVIAVAWWFILKVKGRKKIQASCKICGIAGAFVAFLSFSCLYITASVARYNVAGDVLLYLIFFYCMALFAAELPESTFLKKKYAGMAVTAVFGVLLAGECVFTVDPVTRGLFLKLDTGNTTLCFTGKVSDINSIYYGDYLIYNTQYTYIDKAYDKVLADVDYHPDTTDIYIPDSNGSFICGNLPFYYLNWDEKTKKRVFYENENTQEMEFYNEVKYFSSKMVSEGKDKAVLIVNPYMINVHEEEHLAKLAPYYEIGERKEVKLLQGSIVYYELTRK